MNIVIKLVSLGLDVLLLGNIGGGIAETTSRNYCLNAKNSILKKLSALNNVLFFNRDYKNIYIPTGSLVYCDIPYKNTTSYSKKEIGIFNHDEFYQWVNENRNDFDCYISEYKHNIPENFEIVFGIESKKDIRNKFNVNEKTVEVLVKLK